ncbi:MAG: efflux RND transporter periplasmic adaptor subunit [Terriglobales bacterium]
MSTRTFFGAGPSAVSPSPHPVDGGAPGRVLQELRRGARGPRPRRRRRWGWLTVVVVVMCGAGVVYRWHPWRAAATTTVPTFRLEPGRVQIVAYAKGTLQGGEADRLAAPGIGGDTPRISFLLPAGSQVELGDVVVRFNTGQEEFKLAQALNAAAQAQANIAAAGDQVQAQNIQDAYDLQHARDAVRLAEIAVERNPIEPALTASDNNLSLRSARAQLEQREQDVAAQQANGAGLVAIQQAAAAKAEGDAAAARRHIAAMTLRATRAGYVALEPNPGGAQVLYQGAAIAPFHVGDQAPPGTVVAEIPNLSTLRMQARLSAAGSAYVAPGQAAEVQIDGLPGRVFAARVLRLAGLQAQMFSSAQSQTCVLTIEGGDAALRPGMDAQARIVLGDLRHVLWVPTEALFHQNNQAIVYVLRGGAFSPQPVHVVRQGPSRIAVSGLQAGAVVALADPTAAVAEAQP